MTKNSGDPVVEASRIRKSYRLGRRAVPVLHDVDLQIGRGEMVAIMGPSGCGKTTLLNCLSGLDRVDGGRIVVDGHDLSRMGDGKRTRHRGRHMGFVFQAFNLIPVLSAQKNVEMPLQLQGVRPKVARTRALEALEAVGVADRADHKPLELSGGQQQRVAIARALVNEPAIVWADEPTGNLDTESGRDILELFKALNRDAGVTFAIVTHDEQVAEATHRALHMDTGRITREERR